MNIPNGTTEQTVLTEAEAKRLTLCPMTFARNVREVTKCRGRECAVWRFAEDQRHGWCGIGGKPSPQTAGQRDA